MLRRTFYFVTAGAGVTLLGPTRGQNVTNQLRTVGRFNSRMAQFQQKTIIDQRPAPPQSLLLVSPHVSESFKPPAKSTNATMPAVAEPSVRTTVAAFDAASSKAVEAGRMLRQGQEIQARGDIPNALRSFDAAETEARRVGDRVTAGVAALNHARTLQTGLELDLVQPHQRGQVMESYTRARADP